MRREIARSIKAHYPSKRYDKPYSEVLLKNSKVKFQMLAAEMSKKTGCEILISEPTPPFTKGWAIYLFVKTKKDVYVQKWSKQRKARTLNSGPRYMMVLKISEVGPFYKSYWNHFQVIKGRFIATAFFDAPPKKLKTIQKDCEESLKKEGCTRLAPIELAEEITWLKWGESFIEGTPTVDDCLFGVG